MLGVTWDPHSDTIAFDLSSLCVASDDVWPTQRNVVRLVGRIYDLLGFLAPVTITFKILFQKLCQSKLDWDDDLSEELRKEWETLLADVKEAISISVPRSYTYRVEGSPVTYTLCGFCDASKLAYAAVVYLVMETGVNTRVSFLVFKTRSLHSSPRRFLGWNSFRHSSFPSLSQQLLLVSLLLCHHSC